MSRFLSKKYASLTPYTPGEQPQNRKYIKLNTNESPFPPSEKAVQAAFEEAKRLQLYSDPECKALVKKLSENLGVSEREVLLTNGSDEILNFAFMAFCDSEHPAVFPDITYGFYPVFAQLNNIPYEEIPLKEDFTLDINDYCGINKTIFIANPNAPTGIALSKADIEKIVASNPESVVVIDEAYVDFGGESCVDLIHKYDNLIVTQTFSKSRSMAGARLGFRVGCKALIADLNTIKYSTNPYNINRMTMSAGIGALADETYFRENLEKIIATRTRTTEKLRALGFELPDSSTNFLFVKHPKIGGQALYLALKERGVLVRNWEKPLLYDYNRITVGSDEEMDRFLEILTAILEELA